MGDVSICRALSNFESEIELKIVDAPRQPNSYDCGFYVMKYIRCLATLTMQSSFMGLFSGQHLFCVLFAGL